MTIPIILPMLAKWSGNLDNLKRGDSMGTYVEHNRKEIKGIRKLKYLTVSDIIDAYFWIPLNDTLLAFLCWLNGITKKRW